MIIEMIVRSNIRSILKGNVKDDILDECVDGLTKIVVVHVKMIGVLEFLRIIRDFKAKIDKIKNQ